jgi:hypothetical protein
VKRSKHPSRLGVAPIVLYPEKTSRRPPATRHVAADAPGPPAQLFFARGGAHRFGRRECSRPTTWWVLLTKLSRRLNMWKTSRVTSLKLFPRSLVKVVVGSPKDIILGELSEWSDDRTTGSRFTTKHLRRVDAGSPADRSRHTHRS